MTLKQRVNAGATLLDERRPNWAKEVNLDTLEMSQCCFCVLGQLYQSSYIEGLIALDIQGGDDDINCGFDRIAILDESWDDINRLWRDEILDRINP